MLGFSNKYQYDKNVKDISDDLRKFFLEYEWEGNVRELKHVLEAMIGMTKNEVLQYSELPLYLSEKHKGKKDLTVKEPEEQLSDNIYVNIDGENCDLRTTVELVERSLILKVLAKTKGNKTKAGEILGIPRQTLKYKMSKLGIEDVEK